MPRHYPHLLDPSIYPDYTRRPVKVPTWATFDDRMQLLCLRYFMFREGRIVDYNEYLDLYTEKFKLGRVLWTHNSTLHAENSKEVLAEIARRGLYVFNVWGHLPGAETGPELWQQHFHPPVGMVEHLEKLLGDHFLGIDVGEQDGRYSGIFGSRQCPNLPDRFAQYLNFRRYFDYMGEELGNDLSALVALFYGHYLIREGTYVLLGAETAQGLPNSQIYYAFIRGAGRQYGVPWFGNASVWNWRGFKSYMSEGVYDEHGTATYGFGPEWGTSLNLLKRLIYTHYLYNSVAAGFEDGWTTGDNTAQLSTGHPTPMETDRDNVVISPIGAIQRGIGEFIDRYGQPGSMHAPVAMMLDFFAGWAPPRHMFETNGPSTLNAPMRKYEVWGCRPYETGDYMTHALLSLVFPGYKDSSFFLDERGHLSPTPFGDMIDCVLSDIAPWVLDQYGLVVAAGSLTFDRELTDKLRAFVDGGGRVVVTAENARGLIPGLVLGDAQRIPSGAKVEWTSGITDVETDAFDLCDADLPSDAIILATVNGKPAVVRIPSGDGYFLLLLTPLGLSAEPFVTRIDPMPMQPMPCLYALLNHVRRAIGDELSAQQLLFVGDDLGFITCRRAPGEYTLGIYNNGLAARPFEIVSHIGPIDSITELAIDQSEKGERGYWPQHFVDNDGGVSDDRTIAGGDIRLFSVRVDEQRVDLVTPTPPARPVGRRLSLRSGEPLLHQILARPTFFQHFDGVKLDWDYLRLRDPNQVRREAPWLARQSLAITVDFSHSLNHYPELTLSDNLPRRYRDSIEAIDDVLAKMPLVGARDAVISLHWRPNDSMIGDASIEARFVTNVRDLCARAATHGVTVHIQHHPHKWHNSAAAMLAFIDEVASDNLRFALNVGHLVMTGEDLASTLSAAGDRLGMILLCAPDEDRLGRLYDAHAPVHSSGLDLSVLTAYAHVPQVLDAAYTSRDDEYLDCQFAWRPQP